VQSESPGTGTIIAPDELRRTRFAAVNLPWTELWAARKFVILHGQDIRCCDALGWLVWTGVRWERDATGKIHHKAKDTIRRLYPLAGQIKDDDNRKAYLQFVMRLESRAKIDNLIALAQSEDGVPIRIEDLDRDPWLFNTLNGTIDLRTGELKPHNPANLITKLSPVAYDPNAKCPRYSKFVCEIFADDCELEAFSDRAIGHALTGIVRDAVLHILFGEGLNGKTTLIELALHIMGDYGMSAAPGLLIAKKHEQHPTELADLRGMRFVASMESTEGGRLNEERVKRLTGSDTIKGRYMRQDFFSFEPTHKLFLATNHRPEIAGTDYAIWRRPKLWPFTVTFTEPAAPLNPKPGEKDDRLQETLRDEAPGILARWVRGCLEWQRIGLNPPASVLVLRHRCFEELYWAFL